MTRALARTALVAAVLLARVPHVSPSDPARPVPSGPAGPAGPADPAAVHASALVVDTHLDTPQRLVDEGYDLGAPLGGGQVNLEALARGGVGAIFLVVWVEPKAFGRAPLARATALVEAIRAQVARHPDRLVLAGSAAEIREARRSGRVAVVLGLEGAEPLLGKLAALERFRALGVRYVGLTWNAHTPFADAAVAARPPHGGLSPLGREAIAELNRLGVMVDLSHLSDAAAAQAIRLSRAPVIASHSSARALADHPRNLPDDLLRAVAAKGGVVQVNFHAPFLDVAYGKRVRPRLQALYAAEHRARARDPGAARRAFDAGLAALARELPPPPLSVLLDHVDHVAKVAGVDHVGLGSDFDGGIVPPAGIGSSADFPKITAALLARGHSPEDVRKILGGNLLRVMEEVERVAALGAGAAAPAPARGPRGP